MSRKHRRDTGSQHRTHHKRAPTTYCPSQKNRYQHRRHAVEARWRAYRSMQRRGEETSLRIYVCPMCKGYHLTSSAYQPGLTEDIHAIR